MPSTTYSKKFLTALYETLYTIRIFETRCIQLYREGLIYQGDYIINWCPRCNTALSDLEVDHHEKQGHLYHIRYPLAEGEGGIVVATTRPETMLGDTAVAVHPDDERFTKFQGKTVLLPLVNRKIPVITDERVETDFGTGAVKVTPAHDPVDFELGKQHKLEQVIVIDGAGKMTQEAGEEFEGLDRFECRERVLSRLEEMDFLKRSRITSILSVTATVARQSSNPIYPGSGLYA